MVEQVERWEGPSGSFLVLSEPASRSLASHIRVVERQSKRSGGFRVRDFLDAGKAANHREWKNAAHRALQRFRNDKASSLGRASTHLAEELLQLFEDADTWRGVLNRLAVDALGGRVRDFADTLNAGFTISKSTSVIAREFRLTLGLAETVYSSPDARALVTFLFYQHALPMESAAASEEVDYDRELDTEIDAERQKLEAAKRAEERRWKLEQEHMALEEKKAERAEKRRRFEAEQKARQAEADARRRRAEEEHRRKLAEREAIQAGTYRVESKAQQALSPLMPTEFKLKLNQDGSFVSTFHLDVIGMMNTDMKGSGQWQYNANRKMLIINGTVALQENERSLLETLENIIFDDPSTEMPPQPLSWTFTVQKYTSDSWEGYDNEGKHCVLKKI